MDKIVVIGSLNMDLVTQVGKTPKVGETVLGSGFSEIPGGKGANQAVAIGRLGGQVSMIGRVGEDAFGKALLDNLKANSVDTAYVETCRGTATGLAMIMVNEDGDNSIVVIPGANFELAAGDMDERSLEGRKYLLAQLETPIETIEEAFVLAKEKGLTTVLNPAPARELGDRLIKHTDILVPNETEFELISGVKPVDDAAIEEGARKLFEMGIKAVLITQGKHGASYLEAAGYRFKTAGYKVEAVDTTAAGDSFIGGLLTRLSCGDTMEQAMEYAMKVGAITVSRRGAQSSLPSAEEVDRFEGVKVQ